MEQPKDIFPPVHRKKMGDQDRRRYTGHFQKFLGRLLIMELIMRCCQHRKALRQVQDFSDICNKTGKSK